MSASVWTFIHALLRYQTKRKRKQNILFLKKKINKEINWINKKKKKKKKEIWKKKVFLYPNVYQLRLWNILQFDNVMFLLKI